MVAIKLQGSVGAGNEQKKVSMTLNDKLVLQSATDEQLYNLGEALTAIFVTQQTDIIKVVQTEIE